MGSRPPVAGGSATDADSPGSDSGGACSAAVSCGVTIVGFPGNVGGSDGGRGGWDSTTSWASCSIGVGGADSTGTGGTTSAQAGVSVGLAVPEVKAPLLSVEAIAPYMTKAI